MADSAVARTYSSTLGDEPVPNELRKWQKGMRLSKEVREANEGFVFTVDHSKGRVKQMPKGKWSLAALPNVAPGEIAKLTEGVGFEEANLKDKLRVVELSRQEKDKLVKGVQAVPRLSKIAARRNIKHQDVTDRALDEISDLQLLLFATRMEEKMITESRVNLTTRRTAERLRMIRRRAEEDGVFRDQTVERIRELEGRIRGAEVAIMKNKVWARYHSDRAAKMATARFIGADLREARAELRGWTFAEYIRDVKREARKARDACEVREAAAK